MGRHLHQLAVVVVVQAVVARGKVLAYRERSKKATLLWSERAGDDALYADEVKKRVLTDVKNAAPGLKVSAVRRVRNGVAIEVADSKGLETFKACKVRLVGRGRSLLTNCRAYGTPLRARTRRGRR